MINREKYDAAFVKALKKGIKKKEMGEQLSSSEKVALRGEWFFTMTLPREVIFNIVTEAEKKNVQPSDLIRELVMEKYS